MRVKWANQRYGNALAVSDIVIVWVYVVANANANADANGDALASINW